MESRRYNSSRSFLSSLLIDFETFEIKLLGLIY